MDLTDILIISLIGIISGGYLFWRSSNSKPPGPKPTLGSFAKAPPTKPKSYLSHLSDPLTAILFYGSQTGTAEDLATRFAHDLTESYGISCLVVDPEDHEPEDMSEFTGLACFFLATYGEGEPTDNLSDFYDFVMDGNGRGADEGNQEDYMSDEKCFEGMNYTVFGLGNRTYEYYQAISRRVDKRLTSCGAKRIGEMGEGDDDKGLVRGHACLLI
jgi:NADPH-ferrihemoprotein reductase